MTALALAGGPPVLAEPLRPFQSMGAAEVDAVSAVVASGCLSGFYGSWSDEYWGGPAVKAFEAAWAKRFGVRHAISVNSATSGLYSAMGAIGIGPGDEVIVPPLTMSATVMAPLIYGGIPVFVDVEPDTFCLDIDAVRGAITARTRAILAVNLFGHPARLTELRALADQHGIHLVEDNAQGPLAAENGRLCGTIGHIGVFSLNYHKHIHTGEGGMCTTDDDRLARRLAMIRNHAENVVDDLEADDLTNLIGFNYRMTEMSAAVGIEQLKKVEAQVERRERIAGALTAALEGLNGVVAPTVRAGCRHVSYVYAMKYDPEVVGVSRELFSQALTAEGFPNFVGYVEPLYLLPIFQRRIAMGSAGFPFTLTERRYERGLCPVAESLHGAQFLCFQTCFYEIGDVELEQLCRAMRKVYSHRHELSEIVGAPEGAGRPR